jgi:hypothetical protein
MAFPPTAPSPRLSALDAMSAAVEVTGRRLFPFRLDRWLALGFVAFLDHCGRGGKGGMQFPGGNPGRSGGEFGGPDLSGAKDWIGAHLAIILAVAAIVVVFIVALMALAQWLGSRGVFMYIDNVATGRFDVKRPWSEHAERAWSYFGWSFGLSLVGLFGVLLLLVPIGFLVIGLIGGGPALGAILGIVAVVLVIVLFAITLGLFQVLLHDFAAPLQWKLGVPCGQALGVAWNLVLRHKGTFVVYVLLKIVFAILFAIASVFAGCFTCCLGFLPVISHTLLQPLHYFERAWSLCLLRQAGYDLFPPEPAAAPPPALPPPEPPAPPAEPLGAY